MRILLDTHVLLWALINPSRLPSPGANLVADPANDVCFSPANIWEIAIKAKLGRPGFTYDPQTILEAALAVGFVEVPLLSGACVAVNYLPMLHSDPFDRILIAQANQMDGWLLTVDRELRAYGDPVMGI
jgi:PIN domain nuclease of toxin-antitoxin system